MKKMLSMMLMLVMIFALAVPAFADEAETDRLPYTAAIDIGIIATGSADIATVYMVEIKWTVSPGLYSGDTALVWDAYNTRYVLVESATEEFEEHIVMPYFVGTITNYSNADVDVDLSYENESWVEDWERDNKASFNAEFDYNGSFTLDSAADAYFDPSNPDTYDGYEQERSFSARFECQCKGGSQFASDEAAALALGRAVSQRGSSVKIGTMKVTITTH